PASSAHRPAGSRRGRRCATSVPSYQGRATCGARLEAGSFAHRRHRGSPGSGSFRARDRGAGGRHGQLRRRGAVEAGIGFCLRVEDQRWVYELVGQAVAEEQLSNPAAVHDDWELMWRTVFAAVTPLGPLAEHLADPDVEEVRINGTESCFVFRDGRRIAVPPPFADEAGLVELVHWYTDGAAGARLDRASPMVTMTLPEGSRLHAALSPPAR